MAINLAIKQKTLSSKPGLVEAFTAAKSNNGRLHFLGLVRSITLLLHMFAELSLQSNYTPKMQASRALKFAQDNLLL